MNMEARVSNFLTENQYVKDQIAIEFDLLVFLCLCQITSGEMYHTQKSKFQWHTDSLIRSHFELSR